MKPFLLVVAIFALFNSLLFAEETFFVTDSLRLRIFAEPNEKSTVLQALETGDSVEVISNDGAFSQIRTFDGLIGWVKTAFLVTEPPAILLNQALIDQNDELEEQIQELKSKQLAKRESDIKKIKALEQKLAEQKLKNTNLQEQLSNLKQERLQKEQTNQKANLIGTNINFENIKDFSKFTFILICAALVLIVVGFLLGLKQAARRLRKRLYGYRLG